MAQEECYKQPAYPAVTIKKWMNCFKLRMHEAAFDKQRIPEFRVHIFFQVSHRTDHIVRRRRNKSGVGQSASLRTYPVLRFSEFPGSLLLPSDALHKLSMHLLDKS